MTTDIDRDAIDGLLAALVELAVRDLGERHRVLRKSAAEFIEHDADTILNHLRIDPQAVRARLKRDGRLP